MYLVGQIVVPVVAGAPNGGLGEGNVGRVKKAFVRGKTYPYVSAQAYKRWLRDSMKDLGSLPSPTERSGKGKAQQGFTKADPAQYADDDIFGYMRALKGDAGGTVIRDAVLEMGTLMSVEPSRPVEDFGTMTRGFSSEDNPLIFEHEFYTADLTAPFLFDMAMVGTFTFSSNAGRSNYNSDAESVASALQHGATEEVFRGQSCVRLPVEVRRERVALLLSAFADVAGGAKNALHYGDRSPAVVVGAVMRGGVNPFGYTITADSSGAVVSEETIRQEVEVYGDMLEYGPIIGWRNGYRDDLRKDFTLPTEHPRALFRELANEVKTGLHDNWLQK